MSTFAQRFDSYRRVGMHVMRQAALDHDPYFMAYCILMPVAPFFWAFFALVRPDHPVANKRDYP